MTGAFKFTGAPPSLEAHWKAIKWPKVESAVKRLQMRIAKAEREGKGDKVKALQWILSHSFFAKLLAVKRVCANKGARCPGVDGKTWRTPARKMRGALSLKRQGYQALPLRRILIPKKNIESQEKRQEAATGHTDDQRQSDAGTLSADPLAHRGNPSR